MFKKYLRSYSGFDADMYILSNYFMSMSERYLHYRPWFTTNGYLFKKYFRGYLGFEATMLYYI